VHRTSVAMTALLSALALLTGACNGATDLPDTGQAPAGDATETAPYNDADLEFLRGMIPHHEEAVEMARLVPERTDRPELNQLAEDVIASQEAEIVEMDQLLTDAGAARDDAAGHGGHGDMPGMMGEEEMDRLAGLQGVEFDLAFIDMMIAHHQGAIAAAEQVIDDGENPQVRQLAEDVIAEQDAEIAQMTSWQAAWTPQAN
jgi:uncharacterized protein (DUF305 family)